MKGFKNVVFAAAAPCLALIAVWALGELAIRIISLRSRIYNIEMVKYTTELLIPDPLGVNGHVHRAGASAKLMGVDVSLNSWGHRGKEPSPKTAGIKRVLVLGSSMTMGWGVEQDKVFTSLAEAELNAEKPFGNSVGFQFENAGIVSYDTLAQLNLFKRQYRDFRPDAVVLNYLINEAEPRPRVKSGFLVKHSYFAAYFHDRVLSIFTAGKSRDLAKHYDALYQGEDSAWSRTRGYIAEMRDLAGNEGIPFIVMIIPDIHYMQSTTNQAAICAKVEKDLTAMGIPTVDTFGEFQARFGANERDLWIQPDDPHPNEKGHALMARFLYTMIVARNPLGLPRKRGLRHAL